MNASTREDRPTIPAAACVHDRALTALCKTAARDRKVKESTAELALAMAAALNDGRLS